MSVVENVADVYWDCQLSFLLFTRHCAARDYIKATTDVALEQ